MANTRVGSGRLRGVLCAVALGAAMGIGASPALAADGIDPEAEQVLKAMSKYLGAEMTTDVDTTLTLENLRDVGPRLETLPKGWKYETRAFDKDLVLDTRKSDGWACILRDDLHLTYQACGYDSDASANFIP